MSARFLRTPGVTNGRKAVSAALLVALAMNPSNQNHSLSPEWVCVRGSQHKSKIKVCCSNSINLLHGVEKDREKADFVPLFLRPESCTAEVDESALEAIGDAINAGFSYSKIQALINKRFPKDTFSQHLFTHLRGFWAGKVKSSSGASSIAAARIFDDETTVALKQIEVAQRWFAAHLRTVAEIVQASLYFDLSVLKFGADGTAIPTPEAENQCFMWGLWSSDEIRELHAMAKYFRSVEDLMMVKVKALEAKLDSKTQMAWLKYAERLGSRDCEGDDKKAVTYRAHKCLYAISWMLRNAPAEFFASHRDEFAEVADLLVQTDSAITGPSTQLLKNLSFLGRSIRNLCLTTEDLKPFKEHCRAVVAHKFWTALNEQ